MYAKGSLTIQGTDANNRIVFENCTSSTRGGALCYEGTENTNATIEHASITGCLAGVGGGISLNGGTASLANSVVGRCRAAHGGAVRVGAGAVLNLDAVHQGNTIAGNTAVGTTDRQTGLGAGIYLEEGSELRLAGNPGFGESGNIASTDQIERREDIYIKGYLGKAPEGSEDAYRAATSLVVTGVLTSGEGTIWVGAQHKNGEEDNHHDQLKQFAVFASALLQKDANGKVESVKLAKEELEQTFKAFTNTHDNQYHAEAGDNLQHIYWDGVRGSQAIALRKIRGEDSEALEGAEFSIFKAASTSEHVVKNSKGESETLKGLTSDNVGLIWVGTLAYGVYVVQETKVPDGYDGSKPWRYLVVDEDGYVLSGGYAGQDGKDGRTVAYEAGLALQASRATQRA